MRISPILIPLLLGVPLLAQPSPTERLNMVMKVGQMEADHELQSTLCAVANT
jgi:hypothetical protein